MSLFGVITPNFGLGWFMLCCAFLVHITDEALNNFLQIYNPVAARVNESVPLLSLPIFSFTGWLAGLIFVLVMLFILSIWAFRESRWMQRVAVVYGMIMLLNGMGHILGSLYMRSWMPGVYSSPLVLAGSVYLLWSTYKIHLTS